MAYSEDVKMKVIQKIKEGKQIKEISLETGISIPTLYNWRKKLNCSEKDKKILKNSVKSTEDEFTITPEEQSKIIKKLIKERRYEEAKKIGEEFKDNTPIQSQMITIAIREGNLEEAKKIGERFKDNAQIQSKMKTIAIREKNSDKNENILNRLKTKIYYEKIDNEFFNEIESNESLTEFIKIICLLSICEKKDMKNKAKEIIKGYIPKNKREKNAINSIMERIQSKKQHIFDFLKYDEILQWSFDEKLKKEYEEELKKEKELKEKTTKNDSTKRKKDINTQEQKTTISKTNKKINNKEEIFRKRIVIQPKSSLSQKQKKQESKQADNTSAKRNSTENMVDYIRKFVMEKRKSVYVNMQSKNYTVQLDAISKWDRIEVLLDKISRSSENQGYIESIYNKVIELENKEKGREH